MKRLISAILFFSVALTFMLSLYTKPAGSLAEDDLGYVVGDANGDGSVSVKDASLMLQSLAEWDVTVDDVAADMNVNDRLDSGDVSVVLQMVAEWDVALPNRPPKHDGPISPTHVRFSDAVNSAIFSGASDTQFTLERNDLNGYYVKISTTKATNDPYITFNYRTYVSRAGMSLVSADEYKYVILRMKAVDCSNASFELFFTTSKNQGVTASNSKISIFDNASDSWQYVIFDYSKNAGWTGDVYSFRLDFLTSAVRAGESICVSDVIFAKTIEEAREISGYTLVELGEGLTEEEQERAEQLLAAADPVPTVSNDKVTAANEDASISLWFDHTYTKTPAETVTGNGMNTYQMRMAKNEIEDCQLLLASTENKNGLTLDLSGFKDSAGHTLKSEILYGYYFDDVQGKTIADPTPVLNGSFDLKAGKSQIFVIKVYSDTDSAAGQYSAVLTVKDAAGKEIKKANVYAYVWNFALPEAPACKTLMDIDEFGIYATYAFASPEGEERSYWFGGDDHATYVKYYDLLLENKINAYSIPYTNDGEYDSRADKYIADPRVQAFNPIHWKNSPNPSNIQNAYNYLSERGAAGKGYFYTVDEPKDMADLDRINEHAQMMKEYYPGYKLIVPMHLDTELDDKGKVDYFEYVKDSVNVWCPHNFFFNAFSNYRANPTLTYRLTTKIEQQLGTFAERMAKQQAEGDEVWWYVTRYPQTPEISLSLETQAVRYRIMFWQQKLYDIDGFLYYCVNDWADCSGPDSVTHGVNSKHETDTSALTPYDCYGNGILIYPGIPFGTSDPIGSLRLECVRDGIEDFDYLTLVDELYGEGTSDLVIKQITTSLGEYKADEDLFTEIRTAMGNMIAAANA